MLVGQIAPSKDDLIDPDFAPQKVWSRNELKSCNKLIEMHIESEIPVIWTLIEPVTDLTNFCPPLQHLNVGAVGMNGLSH